MFLSSLYSIFFILLGFFVLLWICRGNRKQHKVCVGECELQGNNLNLDLNSGDLYFQIGGMFFPVILFCSFFIALFSSRLKLWWDGSSNRYFLPVCDVHASEMDYWKRKKMSCDVLANIITGEFVVIGRSSYEDLVTL